MSSSQTTGIENKAIVKYKNAERSVVSEFVSIEEPLEIRLSSITVANSSVQFTVTMRTPGNDEELALGLLFSEGVIIGRSDIHQIKRIDANVLEIVLSSEATFTMDMIKSRLLSHSSCGICGKRGLEALSFESKRLAWSDRSKILPEIFLTLPDKLRTRQLQFTFSGGVHAAALINKDGQIEDIFEDIGRHNALDKLVGSWIDKDRKSKIIMVSGRTSYEIVQKTAMLGVAILVSIGPPSNLAIEVAEREGITLIGFLKSSQFNIYSCPERVLSDDI